MAEAENNARATVQANFALPVGGGALNASARIPVGRTTMTELLPIVRNLENAIIGRIGQEAEEAGTPISCRAGCGACCRHMVPVSLFEAEALTEWMRSLPEDQRAEIERRFHAALSALRDAGVIDKLVHNDWWVAEGPATQMAVDYFHAGVACPFLENENCSIHPIRPLSCREYLVTSPPELCSDPSIHDVHGVQMPLKLSRVLYTFGRQLERDPRGWIPLVFLLAWGRSGLKPSEHFAGTGEEVLRLFLSEAARLSELSEGGSGEDAHGPIA